MTTQQSSNFNQIKAFENLITNTENFTINNKNLFFKDKALLLEQTKNLKQKCKNLTKDEQNKSDNPKKLRSKSTISHYQSDNYDENLSFCQKSTRTEKTNEESKFLDNPIAKNHLKFSNKSSIFASNDHDLSTTVPHSFYEKTSDNSKTFKNKEHNEFYEKQVEVLEERVKELRYELGKKESEIKVLKNGFFDSNIDFNDVFISAKLKQNGFKKLSYDYKNLKKTYEVKLKNQEAKNKKLQETYKKQQNELESMSKFIEEMTKKHRINEKELEIAQKKNKMLQSELKENQNIGKNFENFRDNIEEKLKFYSSKLQKLNENEKVIERISAENQELKSQKNFLMQKIKLV